MLACNIIRTSVLIALFALVIGLVLSVTLTSCGFVGTTYSYGYFIGGEPFQPANMVDYNLLFITIWVVGITPHDQRPDTVYNISISIDPNFPKSQVQMDCLSKFTLYEASWRRNNSDSTFNRLEVEEDIMPFGATKIPSRLIDFGRHIIPRTNDTVYLYLSFSYWNLEEQRMIAADTTVALFYAEDKHTDFKAW